MRHIISVLFLLAITNQVIAHPSVVPHQHPHGLSALGGLDSLLLAALLLAMGWSIWKLTTWR